MRHPILKRILDIVSEETNVSAEDLTKPSRVRDHADARKIFFYAAMKYSDTRFSKSEVGRFLNRDHATVLFAINQAENLIYTDRQFAYLLFRVQTRVNDPIHTLLAFEFDHIPQL